VQQTPQRAGSKQCCIPRSHCQQLNCVLGRCKHLPLKHAGWCSTADQHCFRSVQPVPSVLCASVCRCAICSSCASLPALHLHVNVYCVLGFVRDYVQAYVTASYAAVMPASLLPASCQPPASFTPAGKFPLFTAISQQSGQLHPSEPSSAIQNDCYVRYPSAPHLQVYLHCVSAGVHEVHCRQAACCLIKLHKVLNGMLSIEPVDQPAGISGTQCIGGTQCCACAGLQACMSESPVACCKNNV
jgi:hypothetical protein